MVKSKDVVREKVDGIPDTWVDSLGRTRQHTGLLQEPGRVNQEPEPEIPLELQFMPGTGELPPPDNLDHLMLEPGQVNAEPEPEIDEPFMHDAGKNSFAPARASMIIENPDSRIPEQKGLIERGDPKNARVARRNEPDRDGSATVAPAAEHRLAGQVSGAEAVAGGGKRSAVTTPQSSHAPKLAKAEAKAAKRAAKGSRK